MGKRGNVNGNSGNGNGTGTGLSHETHSSNGSSATQRSKRAAASSSMDHGHGHGQKSHPKIPLLSALFAYFSYGMLIAFGHLRDFFGKLFGKKSSYRPPKGYAPVVNDFEDFYTRRLFSRIKDCWDRPICSAPSSLITIMERKWTEVGKTLELSGSTRECLNLGSYNYLGFGDPNSPCKADVFRALHQYGVSTCSTRNSLGTTVLHDELEKLVARFVGKEDALVFGMGFGTNSTSIPSLVGKGGLILSDATNHASIAIGCRSSGAIIRVFKHNDAKQLEYVIRQSIVEGQPRSHRPWTKILIMVEGIYSMEGELCPLKEIVAVKKKYNCYLYVDEAHSIGAIGRTGRGICELSGVPPSDVDILMGTFTKSFGSVGGYIAASHEIINFVRYSCAGSLYSASISPPACQQIISAIKIILGEDGTDLGARKLSSLRDNANFFRRRLMEMGCHVLGDFDSPVVPLMLYGPGKISAFSRECYKRGLAVVVVGFPATPLLLGRTRFCISAGHTREQLEIALAKVEEVADLLGLRHAKRMC